jgi:hypothetical protein
LKATFLFFISNICPRCSVLCFYQKKLKRFVLYVVVMNLTISKDLAINYRTHVEHLGYLAVY